MKEAVFSASADKVLRHSEHGAFWLDPITARKLLILFRQDEANQADWFCYRAADLAQELEQAMSEAGYLEGKTT